MNPLVLELGRIYARAAVDRYVRLPKGKWAPFHERTVRTRKGRVITILTMRKETP
jgi:hypothetical protein